MLNSTSDSLSEDEIVAEKMMKFDENIYSGKQSKLRICLGIRESDNHLYYNIVPIESDIQNNEPATPLYEFPNTELNNYAHYIAQVTIIIKNTCYDLYVAYTVICCHKK